MGYIIKRLLTIFCLLFFVSQIFSSPAQRINDLLFAYEISAGRNRGIIDIPCEKLCQLCDKGYELKGKNKHSEAVTIFFALREFFFTCNAHYSDEQLSEFRKFFENKKLIDKGADNANIKCCVLCQVKEFNSCMRECAITIIENANDEERRYNRFIQEAEEEGRPRRRSMQPSTSTSSSSLPSPRAGGGSWWFF